MGYCPQGNAINDDLTGRQTLQIFAMLRGVAKSAINSEVDKLLDDLGKVNHFTFNLIYLFRMCCL